MKFRVFGGKLEISNRCGNPPTTFLRNDQLCFGVTQTDTIFANAQNYSYKPHRLEISGRVNLQDHHYSLNRRLYQHALTIIFDTYIYIHIWVVVSNIYYVHPYLGK